MEISPEPHSSIPIQNGTLLRGRYEIESILGEGGFAKTYLAHDRHNNLKCVAKALSMRNIDTWKAKELFDREAKILANLNHPQIPRFIDFFTTDSADGTQIFLVQEFKAGKNLSQLVEAGRHFTEEEVIQIAIQTSEILEYLQSFSPPIIHRDIKPSNILLDSNGQPSLIDFGAVRDKILNDPVLRNDGPTIVGTYGYMPLEQFEGRAVPASDIFSLGVTLIHLLSHKDPWEMEKQGMRLQFQPHVKISRRFAAVLERMIEPDPDLRFASATELKHHLQDLLQPQKIVVPSSRKRNAAVVVSIALITAAGWLWYSYAHRSIPRIVNSSTPRVISPPPTVERPVPKTPVDGFPPFLAPRNVSSMMKVKEHPNFTTYLFTHDLANAQTLDIQAGPENTVWVATSIGILRFDTPSNLRLFGMNADIPGERVDSLAAGRKWVVVDLSHQTKPGYATSTGTYLFDPEQQHWNKIGGSAWDLYLDENVLWIGTHNGVEARDLGTSQVAQFTTQNSGLQHNVVHAIRRTGDVVWFGSLGDYVEQTKDFSGGGVSKLDLLTKQWTAYTTRNGLARDYSCAIAADDNETWIAHWHEEYGLSRYDATTQKWEAVKRSRNGIEIGGVVLAMDPKYLWIGQQRGLVRLDRLTREAVWFTEQDGLPGYIISGIVMTEDAVWASAYSYGKDGIRSAGLVRIPRTWN